MPLKPLDPRVKQAIQKLVNQDSKLRVNHGTGQLQYYFRGSWEDAVFHDEIRQSLIDEAAKEGNYTYGRESGLLHLDITSFHGIQKDWAYVREHRPAILFQIRRDVAVNKPKTGTLWRHKNKMVLDYAGHPIPFYPELPSTISSEIEGWLLEAIERTNPSISTKDFRSRMTISGVAGATCLGNRKRRGRVHMGAMSWKDKSTSEPYKARLEEIIPKEFWEMNNSNGWRDLGEEEAKWLDSSVRGKGRREEMGIRQANDKEIKVHQTSPGMTMAAGSEWI